MLTARKVECAGPTGKVQYLHDGDGLYLKISTKGTRTWMIRYRDLRRARWLTLGRYPRMSLLEARNKADELRRLGVHQTRTVEVAYGDYRPLLDKYYDSAAEIERRLKKDFLARLGHLRLDQITRQHIGDVLHEVVKRGAPVAANRMLPDIHHFFDYCVSRGWISDNPATGLVRKFVGGKEEARNRNLSLAELRQLAPHLLERRFHDLTRIALGLILITGQRPGEVLKFDTTHVHPGHWWHIPPGFTKSRRLQKVYLSPQARCLLKYAVNRRGKRPFIGMDARVLSKAVSRIDFEPSFTPHDLRRTMATRLAEAGIPPHVLEKMLNHKTEGALAVYNHAEYLPERKAAWQLWGRMVAKVRRETYALRRTDRHVAHPVPGAEARAG